MPKLSNLRSKLIKANTNSQKAIEKFTSTERELQAQIDVIDEVITDINSEITELESLKASAIDRRYENSGIISRIRKIVSGD